MTDTIQINVKKLSKSISIILSISIHIFCLQYIVKKPSEEIYVKYTKREKKKIINNAKSLDAGALNIKSKTHSISFISASSFSQSLAQLKAEQKYKKFLNDINKTKKIKKKDNLIISKKNSKLKFNKGKSQVASSGLNTSNKISLEDYINYEDTKGLSDLDTKAFRLILSKNYSQFRKCYEKALLRDQLLRGSLYITLSIPGNSGNSNVRFKGKGNNQGVSSLKGCIQNFSKRIKFPKKLFGNKVKFTLYFNS